MKVVLSSIKNKVDEAITKYGKKICRIELTNGEFEAFLHETEGSELKTTSSVRLKNGSFAGSYIKYREVCVQTANDYTCDGFSVETVLGVTLK